MNFPAHCVETEHGAVISRQEGTVFRLLNPKRVPVRVVHVDGCVLTDRNTKKCDYLFLPTSPAREIYVEFKGKSVEDGIGQLEATIHKLSAARATARKYCFLIPTRVPRPARAMVQVAKDRFQQRYNARLTVKTQAAEHDLTD